MGRSDRMSMAAMKGAMPEHRHSKHETNQVQKELADGDQFVDRCAVENLASSKPTGRK
jgi:hypothetical protein